MIYNLNVMFQIFRKQIIFLLVFVSITLSIFAQKADKSIKPFSGAKPFRKFSVGISAGALKSSVLAGGSNDFSQNNHHFGYGMNVKYQITHYLALQADFVRGKLSGDNSKKRGNDTLNLARAVTAFSTELNAAVSGSVLYTFSNINWLHLKNWFVPYIGIGGGLANYDVKFTPRGSNIERPYPDGLKNNITELYVPISVGVRFKLTKLLNLNVGYTMNFVDGDNLDGNSYWTVPLGESSTTHKDKFSYAHAGLEIALGKRSKPELLFDNPAARINNIMQDQVKLLTQKVDSLEAKQKGLDDTDGDSVADLFDKEPNTPAGCPVDASGIMRDTDGDGIVDCKDKQLITPSECLPVDIDGVGKCPDPSCCLGRTGDVDVDLNSNCPSDYPALTFKGNSIKLSAEIAATIATIATKMKARPDCKIMIKGNSETSKSSQAICQKRVDAIKMQLKEREGISAERITTNCEVGGGDKNTVEITSN